MKEDGHVHLCENVGVIERVEGVYMYAGGEQSV